MVYSAEDEQHCSLKNTYSLKNNTELDMASANSLSDFIVRTVRNFPADKYGLVLWDHGKSFQSYVSEQFPTETRA